MMRRLFIACLIGAAWSAGVTVTAQQAAQTPRSIAPVDLTGNWVSVISEDWQWRMVTPAKGDFASLPLNAAGQKTANAWTPGQEYSCKAFGAAAVMRVPGRVRISWENDSTLKIETDAGVQTRRLRFSRAPEPAGPRTLQGQSRAEWQFPGALASSGAEGGTAGPRVKPPVWASLKVVTTNMLAGYLRANGVPYSENAVMTEYFDRFSDGTDEWFAVTTVVEDPTYLQQPLVISSNFRREPDGSKWDPLPCQSN